MKRLEPLDCARFIAALTVLAYHYLVNGIRNGKIDSLTHIPSLVPIAKYGYLGVELFFVISGYVIFFSARDRSASEFAVSRALRLYPAFWLAVPFTASVAYFWGGDLMSVGLVQTLLNLTMVPELLGVDPVDGVYWTLQLELTFYLGVLGLLLLGLQRRLAVLFLLWPVAILAIRLAGELPYLWNYFAYFAAGAIFAIQKDRPSKWTYASLTLCLYLCVSFSAFQRKDDSPYVIAAVICAIFAFFFVLNLPRVANARIPGSRLLGGLTYPIYLIHAGFGYMFLSRFGTDENKAWMYPLTIAIVLAVAYLIHTVIEKRMAPMWRAIFTHTVGLPIAKLSAMIDYVAIKWRATIPSRDALNKP
jgi:peptidoglycan/LPS O-acetylase OafA/YrhL